jgi:hypothetical protein
MSWKINEGLKRLWWPFRRTGSLERFSEANAKRGGKKRPVRRTPAGFVYIQLQSRCSFPTDTKEANRYWNSIIRHGHSTPLRGI